MAKRKHRLNRPDQRVTVIDGLVLKPEQNELTRLAKAGESNLLFLEDWAETMPKVNDVPVVRALTYELIQILNRACLRLPDDPKI